MAEGLDRVLRIKHCVLTITQHFLNALDDAKWKVTPPPDFYYISQGRR